MNFIIFMAFILLLRMGELILSGKNEKKLLQQGAVQYGKQHYPFMIALHTLFFVSLVVEYVLKQPQTFSLILLVFYFLLLAFKVWVLSSLGHFWSTKIYHIAGVPLIKKGPYKFMKHPNYLIVIVEILIIPLIFHLYITAIIFSVLNGCMLFVRINEENKVLRI